MKKIMVCIILMFSLIAVSAFAFDDDTYQVSSGWHYVSADQVELSLTYTSSGSRFVLGTHFVAKMNDGTYVKSDRSSLHNKRINQGETLTGNVGFRHAPGQTIVEISYEP